MLLTICRRFASILTLYLIGFGFNIHAQGFPNPSTLSTGQGAPGTIDPLWLASPWYAAAPPNPMGLPYISTLINNNCAPGAWVDPASLPPPMNNGNWITGSDGDCATNTQAGYRYFRLTLNLPPDCNGFSVTNPGTYILSLIGYADNTITDVFVNGNSTGISGGSFGPGTQLSISLGGPWLVGTNYVDVLVYNFPSNPGDINPYGLLLVADANATDAMDTDGDGISNLNDLCPCDAGTNPYGCTDPTLHNCDIDAIRDAFTNAGCVEMPGCSSDCSIYFLNPTPLTGSDAQSFAETLGANLVSVQSLQENECILTGLNNLGYGVGDVVWIGFSDELVEGSFVWYDQSPVVYTNWAPGEPNQAGDEDCVQIYPGGGAPGTWNDLPCSSSNSKSIIEVNLCPVIDAGPDQIICLGEDANLQSTATLFGSAPYDYLWSTGQTGQSILVSPTDTTEYSVLTTDLYECEAMDSLMVYVVTPPVSTFSATTVCQGFPTSFTDLSTFPDNTATINQWSWDFGDGFTSTSQNPTHVFANSGTHVVQLTVTSTNGCTDVFTFNVTVHPKPVADFSFSDVCEGTAMSFSNESTIASGTILSNEWHFGDGGTSNNPSPNHQYFTFGTYSAQLIVTSLLGCKDTITQLVEVFESPVANFNAVNVCDGELVTFNNTSTPVSATSTWDFGDGSSATGLNQTHNYTQAGNYSVELTVTDLNNCESTVSQTISVFPNQFLTLNETICEGESYFFGGNAISVAGNYQDLLQTSNGCDSLVVLNLSVLPRPATPEIISNSPLECPGDELYLSIEAVSGASYFWLGPNGFTNATPTFYLTLDEAGVGTYSVYITVNGCPSFSDSELIQILGSGELEMTDFPNIITPNGDGINEFLNFDDYFTSCLNYSVVYLNRWGSKVFEQKMGSDPFTGVDFSGNELTDGVYFYTLRYGDFEKSGHITISR